jgi:hypothetical protein
MTTEQLTLTEQYRAEGYESHFNRYDNQAAIDMPCVKCCGNCIYIGLKKQLATRTSYVAISRCTKCGHEIEF